MPLDWGMKIVASYHHLTADQGNFDYGNEIDLMLTKNFLKHYSIGTKASFYDADQNAANTIGGPAFDVTKVWVWAGVSF